MAVLTFIVTSHLDSPTATAGDGSLRGEVLVANAVGVGNSAVIDLLGSLEDRGDDPVLEFYKPQVEEIRKADGTGSGKVWGRYEARRKERDQWVAREAVFSRLKEFDAKHFRDAIAYHDEQIKKPGDRDLLWRLERTRQVYLEWDHQHEKALTNARQLLKSPDLSEKDRESLLDREAYNLHNLGRIDDLLAHYDRRVVAACGDTRKSLALLRDKAQWISYYDRPEQPRRPGVPTGRRPGRGARSGWRRPRAWPSNSARPGSIGPPSSCLARS
jgi:hypothetical protein